MNRWAILRVIKYKTLLKLNTAVFVLAAAVIAGLVPSLHASADAPTPTLPIVWADNAHTNAVDSSGNVYLPMGYSCFYSNVIVDRTTKTLNSANKPTGTKSVSVATETGDQVNKSNVPSCPPRTFGRGGISQNSVADYIWVSSRSPNYVLDVNSPIAGTQYDTKQCPINGKYNCTANISLLNPNGSLASPIFSDFKMIVDTSKASAVAGASSLDLTSFAGSPKSCESSGFTLAWIACPIIDGMAKAVDGIYGVFLQPLLVTKPISLDTTCAGQGITPQACNPNFSTWSNFRVYGDIFLVIALLVVVFGQSIGGGLIDAYAAKKILPRLLMAAILINLSFYIVAFAVDITNIIGQGIQTLLTQPLVSADAFKISMNAGSQAVTVAVAGLGLTAAVGALFSGTLIVGAIVEFLPLILMFVLLPALLVFLSILFTLILRQGLIILLLIVSPIAFALYCLPNTEKYFKRWWDLLFRTLLIYPIIAVLFSLGNILSVILQRTSQANAVLNTLAQLMSFIGLVIPLFLIPFAFKISGGMLGKFQEITNNIGKRGLQAFRGNPNDPYSRQNRAKFKAGDRATQLREQAVSAGKASGATRGKKLFGRAMNYGNLQATRSRYNKMASDQLQTQIATGDDSNIRDMFLAWDADAVIKTDDEGKPIQKGGWFRRMDMKGDHAVPGASAVYEDHDTGLNATRKARSLHGGSKSYLQDALYYEWKKTTFDPEKINRIQDQYSAILEENGITEAEGSEVMTGVGYRHGGQSLGSKYGKFKRDKTTGKWKWQTDYIGLAAEGSLGVDTYAMSRQDVKTFKALEDGYKEASAILGDDKDYSNDNTIVENGFSGYTGKTKAQVYKAKQNFADMASKLNPQQQTYGGGRQVPPADDGGEPQFYGAGGISNAPVQVQAAAVSFYNTVFGSRPPAGTSTPQDNRSVPPGSNV